MTKSPENQESMPFAPSRFCLAMLPCRDAVAWAWPLFAGVALALGGGCSMGESANIGGVKPATLFKDDFTKDEAWRAKVKRDSFPDAKPSGL